MNPIHSVAELKQQIADLERKTKAQEVTIKGQFGLTKEALKPRNVLRNSFSSLAAQPEIRKAVVTTLIGFGIGYFSKKATAVLTEENLNRVIGGFAEHALDKIVERDPNGLMARGIHLTRQVAKEKGLQLF